MSTPGNRSAVIPLKRGRSAAVSLATFMSFIARRRTCEWVGGIERGGRRERGGGGGGRRERERGGGREREREGGGGEKRE